MNASGPDRCPAHVEALDVPVGLDARVPARPEKVIARVMDVANYHGNIDFVQESRVVPDPVQ